MKKLNNISLSCLLICFTQSIQAFTIDPKAITAASWLVKTLPTTNALLDAYILATARSKTQNPSKEVLEEACLILKGLGEDPEKFEFKIFSTPIQNKHISNFLQFMDEKPNGTFVIYMSAGGIESSIISPLDRYGLLLEHIIRALYTRQTKRDLVVQAAMPFVVALFWKGYQHLMIPDARDIQPDEVRFYKNFQSIIDNPFVHLITSVVFLAQVHRLELSPAIEARVQKEADRIIKKYK